MTERYLFLPDNLMTVLYKEQKLIQNVLNFPFRKTIPLFKTEFEYDSLTILSPIVKNGLIIRPCVDGKGYKKQKEIKGFVLGDAGSSAAYILSEIENLKTKTKLPVFTKLQCRSWYYADVEFYEDKQTGLCLCTIQNKAWKKGKENLPKTFSS